MIIFIDDAGDPGFKLKRGSSTFFIISLVIFDDFLEAEKCSLSIKELRRKLKVSDMYEFKFNKISHKYREKFLKSIMSYDFKVRSVVVDKSKIYSSKLRSDKESFYNYIIMQVLKNSGKRIKNAKLKFDSRGERLLRNQLRVYLSNSLDNKKNAIFNDLKFVDSKENTLIQLADMVSGSIYAYYTSKNSIYLDILTASEKMEDLWEFK